MPVTLEQAEKAPELERAFAVAQHDPTRENVMRQAANFQKFRVPMLLPGITVSTSATDFYPIDQLQIMQFKGEKYELQGPIITGGMGGS